MKRWSKRISALLLICLMAVVTVMPALAAEMNMDYDGEVQLYTGVPMTELEAEYEDQTRDLIEVSPGTSYDKEMGAYVISTSAGNLYSNVVSGMTVTTSVAVIPEDGMEVTLMKDGIERKDISLTQINVVGSYSVKVKNGSSRETALKFNIVPEASNILLQYTVPAGFTIQDAIFSPAVVSVPEESEVIDPADSSAPAEEAVDSSVIIPENEQTVGSSDFVEALNQVPEVAEEPVSDFKYTTKKVPMTGDGNYSITYVCDATGITYRVNLYADHTAPTLKLEAVKDGVAKSAVDVSDAEKNSAMVITRDGMSVKPSLGRLTQPGNYVLEIADPYGNSTVYRFRIKLFFNLSSVIFFVVVLLLVLLCVGYIIFIRKRMRVR